MTIKELCKKFGMSQAQLSKKFEIPYRTVQDWHSGKRNPPQYIVKMMNDLLEKQ